MNLLYNSFFELSIIVAMVLAAQLDGLLVLRVALEKFSKFTLLNFDSHVCVNTRKDVYVDQCEERGNRGMDGVEVT